MESDTAIQNSVMRLAKQQGQSPAQLEQYLIRLHQLGLKPEEQTYNILLRAYAEHGDLKAAAEILDRMGADGTPLGLVVLILFNLLYALQDSPTCLIFSLCNRMTACCMSAHRTGKAEMVGLGTEHYAGRVGTDAALKALCCDISFCINQCRICSAEKRS